MNNQKQKIIKIKQIPAKKLNNKKNCPIVTTNNYHNPHNYLITNLISTIALKN